MGHDSSVIKLVGGSWNRRLFTSRVFRFEMVLTYTQSVIQHAEKLFSLDI
jgi:hypothetical protein